MKRWLVIVYICCLPCSVDAAAEKAVTPDSDLDSSSYTCSTLLEQLRTELRKSESTHILLKESARHAPGSEDEGEPCKQFAKARQALYKQSGSGAERGRLAGSRAAVLSDGPHGSGHYWDITIAVESGSQVVGACLLTSTAGWRNISGKGTRLFGRWRALAGDRFHLWSDLEVGSSLWDSLLVPLVFRIEDRALVLDWATTLREISRFAKNYATLAMMQSDLARELHRAAAAAYHAYSAGTDCPP